MNDSRRVGILGSGSYVPERVLSNEDLEKMVDTSDEWIFTRTGMRERRIADPRQATSDLAVEAGQRAIEDAGVAPEDIDLIIVATVTPDHMVPATACLVAERLGLRAPGAFDLEAACTGFVTALITGRAMVAAGSARTALVIGAECMSRIVDYEDRASCILFGDAAGAVVISADAPRGEILHTFMGSDGSGADVMKIPAGGSRRPLDMVALEERLNYLHIRGNETFKFAVGKFRELVERQMHALDFTVDDLGLVVPHQVNYRIIESALKKLDVDLDRIFMNLHKYGNTAAASVPVAFDEARREGRFTPGKYVSIVAFGAGLTWSSVLLRW